MKRQLLSPWCLVFLLHGCALCLLLGMETPSLKREPNKQLAVRTLFLTGEKPKLNTLESSQPPSSPTLQEKEPDPDKSFSPAASPPLPVPKKPTSPKPPAEKKPLVPQPQKKTATTNEKPKAPPSNKKSDQQNTLLNLAKKSLEQLETANASSFQGKKASPSAVKKIEALSSERIPFGTSSLASYQEEIAAYLKHLVQLPEPGDVKLKLTVTKEGKVSSLAITACTSSKNRDYVEKKIPNLLFPPFGERIKSQSEHTFPIVLSGKVGSS